MDYIRIENCQIDHSQLYQLDVSLGMNSQGYSLFSKQKDRDAINTILESIKTLVAEAIDRSIEQIIEDIAQSILNTYSWVQEINLSLCRIEKKDGFDHFGKKTLEINRKRNRSFIALGSNMDNPKEMVEQAMKLLGVEGHTSVKNKSSLIITEPWGLKEQPEFVNSVIEVETYLEPDALLLFTQSIEETLGRVRTVKWGPRRIDLDILYYNDAIIYDEHLKIPHPYAHERSFVVEPMKEIAPFYIHPVTGQQIREINISN